MEKDKGWIYKHSQSQLSTLSIKGPVILSLASQTSFSIELTITSVPYVRDKNVPVPFCVPKIPSRII